MRDTFQKKERMAADQRKAEFLRSQIIIEGLGITDASDEEVNAIIDAIFSEI